MAYDNNSNVISKTDQKNQTTNYYYDGSNNIIKIVNPSGVENSYEYDTHSNLIKTIDGNGNINQINRNQNGLITQTISAAGQTTTYTHDVNGYVNSMKNNLNQITTYVNSNEGNVTQSTNPIGGITQIFYNNNNNITKTIDENGVENTTTYNNRNWITKTTDGKGNATEITYDAMGNVLETKDAIGNINKNVYDERNNLILHEDEKGNITTFETDFYGNITKLISPTGDVTIYEYNNQLLNTKTTLPSGKSDIKEYDELNRIIKTTNAENAITTYSYNSSNKLIKQIDSENRETQYEYNNNNQLVKIINPNTTQQNFIYDADGKETSNTDSNGNTTSYIYDAIGNVKQTSELGTDYIYNYDNLNRIINETNLADNTTKNYTYTPTSLVDTISYSDNSQTLSYEYDANGKQISMSDNTGKTTYAYDNLNRLIQKNIPNTGTIKYSYDNNSQIANITHPNGLQVSYSYNNNNQLSKLNINNTEITYGNEPGVINENITYEYNNDNVLVKTIQPNNTETKYEYDNIYRIVNKKVDTPHTTLNYDYEYDETNLITKKTTNTINIQQNDSYTYDALSRMNTINNSGSFSFDNINKTTQLPDGTNFTYTGEKITQKINTISGTDNYSYDVRGNRTSHLKSDSNGSILTDKYIFNVANQMVQANLAANPPNENIEYDYNGEGLRVKKTKNTDTEIYAWDSNNSVATVLEDNQNNYIYEPNSSKPVAQINKNSGDINYIINDSIGSTRATINDLGIVTGEYNYDEYGNQTVAANVATETPFKFAGEYLDEDTGFYYLRARWYDPQTTQFTTVDPILNSTHLAYGYTAGNPLSFTDPLGLDFGQDLTQLGLGTLDGLTGGLSTEITNAIAPGLINSCSAAFAWGVGTGTVASFLIPGGTALKVLGSAVVLMKLGKVSLMAAAGAGKYAKVANKAEQQLLKETTKAKNLPFTPAGQQWQRGENILSNTKNGNAPSWDTQRQRWWKNQHKDPDRPWTDEQMERMKDGKAPQRKNDDKKTNKGKESMELSHEPIGQRNGGTDVAMRWPPDHARVDDYRKIGYESENYGTGGVG